MSSFTAPLRVEITQHKRRGRLLFRTLEPFVYEVGRLGSGDVIRVEAGFWSDFGSVPRLLWVIEPPLGDAAKADVIHDQLYSTGSRPRAAADAIWLEAMAVLGVPAWRRYLRWLPVRLFGWRNFGKPDPVPA